jgi:hypothetical protein
VPDGTLYTVSSTNGEITTSDADTTAGIQISSVGGQVTFSLRSSQIPFPAIVRVLSLTGLAAGTDTVSFYDTGTPATPTGLQVATITQTSVEMRWNRNPEADLGGYRIYFDTDSPQPPYTGKVAATAIPSPIDVASDTSVTIMGLDLGTPYYVTVTAYDVDGNESGYCPSVITAVTADVDGQIPTPPLALRQNFPNPFNPSTTIEFSLPTTGPVSLIVYDVLGRRVRTLVAGQQPAGTHRIVWDATNDRGGRIASGVYFYILKTPQGEQRRKMVVLR